MPDPEPFPQRLIDGYQAFLGDRFAREQARFRELAENGQKPRIMLIGCCDSRVSPEVIFDMRPGEMFVVRNVANIMPPYAPNDDYHGTSAALEFAVMGLRVEHIVIMGHGRCGGVAAFIDGERDPYQRPLSPGDFIGKWMSLISETAKATPMQADEILSDYVERLSQASVRQSLENLRSFPCVKTLEERGRLHVHGAYFDVMSGLLKTLDSSGNFSAIAPEMHRSALEVPRF